MGLKKEALHMNLPWTKRDTMNQRCGLMLLLGAAGGLMAGLLIARTSGADLRAEIAEAAKDYLDTAANKLTTLKGAASDLASREVKAAGETLIRVS